MPEWSSFRMLRPEPDNAGAKLMVSLPNTTSQPKSYWDLLGRSQRCLDRRRDGCEPRVSRRGGHGKRRAIAGCKLASRRSNCRFVGRFREPG
jgi:hypothetical protein